jgi:CMP-N-acetylneuraminic acid synthetase
MYHSRKVTAIIPIKDQSERVPGKNFRNFCGKPLYHHILETLERTYAVDEVLVDTDSPRVMQEASKLFPKVRVIERPETLRGHHVSVNKIIAYDLQFSDAQIFMQTHATNPLLRPETVSAALHAFVAKEDEFDSLFSVNRFQSRFYDANRRPINHDPEELIRTQELPPVYEENSVLYIFTKGSFEKRQRRIGEQPQLFTTPPMESTDIDDELQFRLAEMLAMYAASNAP